MSSIIAPKIIKLFRRTIKSDSEIIPLLEMNLKHKNGNWVPIEAGTTILKKDGKTIGTLNILRDISKRKKADEKIRKQNIQLLKLDELKTAFLNVTSHELRTPISAIKGYVQILLKQIPGVITDKQKHCLDVILSQPCVSPGFKQMKGEILF